MNFIVQNQHEAFEFTSLDIAKRHADNTNGTVWRKQDVTRIIGPHVYTHMDARPVYWAGDKWS